LFSASAADRDTLVHIAHLLATGRARLAYLFSYCANLLVHRRTAQQKIRTGLADVSTVEHQAKMRPLHMLTARIQTVPRQHLRTHTITVQTLGRTFLHPLMFQLMFHKNHLSVIAVHVMCLKSKRPPSFLNGLSLTTKYFDHGAPGNFTGAWK
jgi:hypothetical protein